MNWLRRIDWERRRLRGNCSKIFFKIGVLKNLAIFIGRHLRWKTSATLLKSFFYRTSPVVASQDSKRNNWIQHVISVTTGKCELRTSCMHRSYLSQWLVAGSLNLMRQWVKPLHVCGLKFNPSCDHWLMLSEKISSRASTKFLIYL